MMPWTSKSKEAKDLAAKGLFHFLNIEQPQAYDYFVQALDRDPNLTLPLVLMANMTTGETKKAYIAKVAKSATHKTEGEKLLASLSDEKGTPETRRDAWDKLHTMYPNDATIASGYVNSRATPEERFAAAQEFIEKFPDIPWMYNTIGYYYLQDKKDPEMAKKNFEKYIELYPEGYNPYDSMGEFYLLTGDLDNAEKYYSKALEIYPYANSSLNALEKIKEQKKMNAPNEEKKN